MSSRTIAEEADVGLKARVFWAAFTNGHTTWHNLLIDSSDISVVYIPGLIHVDIPIAKLVQT